MFGKNSNDERPEAEPSLPPLGQNLEVRTRRASVIGPTLKFNGELSANEDLIIEGEIEGIIAHKGKNLTVGKQGRVYANIRAEVVEIQGEVNGDIRGDDVVKLTKTAVVTGNIQTKRLVMEDGAFFSGSISMQKVEEKKEATVSEIPPIVKKNGNGAESASA